MYFYELLRKYISGVELGWVSLAAIC